LNHEEMNIIKMKTESGIFFEILPIQSNEPAPTLLLFAMSGLDTLTVEPYCLVGKILHSQGWNVVSFDLPCHGADIRINEPAELQGWAYRTAQNEDIVSAFILKVNDIVSYLVKNSIADLENIFTAGISRGGFMAFHAASGNLQIRAVAAFSPVTDLLALTEFAGQENNPLVKKMSLMNIVDKMVNRNAWVTIGNADFRVDTEKVIDFTATLSNNNNVDLHVLPCSGHCSFPEWHHDAAIWLNNRTIRRK
jgi:dienelactone hydrolase